MLQLKINQNLFLGDTHTFQELSKECACIKEIVPNIATSATNDLIKDNLPRLVTDVVKNERESSQRDVSTHILQEFAAHAPQIIEEHEINRQAQVVDLELWNVVKAKFEKSSALVSSCRIDAFRKRDHDDHQGDDAPLEGEKNAKRQKISKSSKSARGSLPKQLVKETITYASEQQLKQQDWDAWVDIPVIDEDEEILKEETSELINEYLGICLPLGTSTKLHGESSILGKQARGFETTIAEALVFYGPQRNPNEPSRYLYNKDLFFLKNGNTEEKKYMLSLHKIHATSFPKEDLEEKMIR
ncbi:hypothetical protein Tco_1360966 [Tanacetum coccineum]